MKIEEVYNYGAGTKQLPVGSLLDISIPKSELDDSAVKLEDQQVISLRISISRSFSEEASADWKFVMFLNN